MGYIEPKESTTIMCIGTYSDDVLIEKLKEKYNHLVFGLTDEQIKVHIIDKGRCPIGLVTFFAEDIKYAKKAAKQMKLKNFSRVSSVLYEVGKHY